MCVAWVTYWWWEGAAFLFTTCWHRVWWWFMPPSHWATISYYAKDHAMFWKLAWTWGDLGRNLMIQCIFFNIWHGRMFITLMLVYVTLTLSLCTVLLRVHMVFNAFPPGLYQIVAAAATMLPRHCRCCYGHATQGTCLLGCCCVYPTIYFYINQKFDKWM